MHRKEGDDPLEKEPKADQSDSEAGSHRLTKKVPFSQWTMWKVSQKTTAPPRTQTVGLLGS